MPLVASKSLPPLQRVHMSKPEFIKITTATTNALFEFPNHVWTTNDNEQPNNYNHGKPCRFRCCYYQIENFAPQRTLRSIPTHGDDVELHSQGAGLIQLLDRTVWATVPRQDELNQQYRNFSAVGNGAIAANTVKEGEATRAFKEVGSAAVIETINSNYNVINTIMDYSSLSFPQTTWLRVMSRLGVTVVCPPSPPEMENNAINDDDNNTSPTLSSSRGYGVQQRA